MGRQFHQQAQVQQQQYAAPQERHGLVTNAVIALGVLSLVNSVATVASGWFGNKDDEDDKDKEDEGEEEADKEKKKGRSLVSKKTLETLENAAVDALLKAKEK